MQIIQKEIGASLIVVIVLLLVLGMVLASMVSLVSTESFNAMNQNYATQALDLATSGLERAVYRLKTGTACTGGALNGTNALGAGTFTTTGTQYNPTPTTLAVGGITATATTITLTNPPGNANYAPHGRVQIDSELIEYTGRSGATQLTGAQRGVNGTQAVAHLAGATVLQTECLINSTGTIASPLPAISNTQRVVESAMVTSSHQGSFTKSTAGAPVNQSVTGVGFRPQAVIFFWTRQTATGFAPQNSRVNFGVGFATGSANERAVSVSARDRRGSSDDGRRYSESNAIIILTGGGPPTLVAQAGLVSMDPDGFTIQWTTNDANAYLIHYIALGGDITNAFASSFNLTTGGGNQSVNGVGFQPDFVLFLWGHTGALDTNLGNAEIGLGLAKSSAARGAIVYAGLDASGPNTAKQWQQRTDSVILLLTPTVSPPTQDAIADFVSMDVDGFTINKSDTPAANTTIFYLALKGGRHQVGAFNQATAIGNQAIAGVGFRPEQLLLTSFNLIAQVGVVGGGAVSLGVAQYPTARGSVWFQDRSDNDPSDTNSYTNTTDVMTLAYGTAVGGTDGNPAVRAQADFVSFNQDGFTLNWITADATARQILYWAIGPYVPTGRIDWQEIY